MGSREVRAEKLAVGVRVDGGCNYFEQAKWRVWMRMKPGKSAH